MTEILCTPAGRNGAHMESFLYSRLKNSCMNWNWIQMRWLVVLLTIVLTSACSSVSESDGAEDVPQRTAADLATVRAEAGLDDASPTQSVSRPSPTAKSRLPTAT